jgi:hypothetical protein
VQAAHYGLHIIELPVPLVYLDEVRSFGGSLDDGRKRMEYYHRVLDKAIDAVEREGKSVPGRDSGEVNAPPTQSITPDSPAFRIGCSC